MSTVYRIQDSEGRGPWRPGFSEQWTEDRSDAEYAALKPWPQEFGMGPIRRRIVGMHIGCACNSLAQLRRWFTAGEYAKLKEFGYQSVKMEVGRVLAASAIQCVFERAKPLNEEVEPFELYD